MQDILDKIQEMKNELQQLEQRVNLRNEDKLFTYILDKVCNIDEIEVEMEDINKNNTLYYIERTNGKIILRRL